MLISETIKIRIASRNYKYYRDKGYIFEKVGDIIDVKVEDLPPKTHAKVKVKCDICGKIFERKCEKRNKGTYQNFDTCCRKCTEEYNKIVCKEKYGMENPMQSPIIKEKAVNTNIERYGVKNPMQLKEVKDKVTKTLQERHGVSYPIEVEGAKDRAKLTFMEHYGVENPMQSKEIRDKTTITNIEKYGVENPMQNPDIVAKGVATKFERGAQKTSKGQKLICDYVGGLLNYPLYNISLDIALLDEKIDIEYNGGGHDLCVKLKDMSKEEFNAREDKRRQRITDFEWNIIEICNPKDKDFSKDEIMDFIVHCKEKFKSTNTNYITLDLISGKIEYFTL